MNKYKDISRGVSNFLKENEGEYTLEYLNKAGDVITRDYITGYDEAINVVNNLASTYKAYGSENAYALLLIDEQGKEIANAADPDWVVSTAENINEDASDIETAEPYIYDEYREYDRYPEYEDFNDSTMSISRKDFNKALNKVKSVIDNVADHFYTSDGHEYLELHDHHTVNRLTNEDKDISEWGDLVNIAIDSFEEATGVELWQAGRMGRHMVVEPSYENAKRYDELVKICCELEDYAIEEFNEPAEAEIEESEDTLVGKQRRGIKDMSHPTDANSEQLKEEVWNEDKETEYKGVKISIEKSDKGKRCYIPLTGDNFKPEKGTQFFSLKDVKKYIDSKLGENKLNEEILSDAVENACISTIAKIDELISTIRHTVEMDIMSINSQIETINDKTSLNLEEIDLSPIYDSILDVKKDLEYALKNSEWSKEEAMDESEKLKETWEEVDSKSVQDSDGFSTDYTLYKNNEGKYRCVFGDKDVYTPDEDSDMDFDNEDEAREWFNSYEGLVESEDDEINSSVKEWYKKEYPDDDYAEHMKDRITFYDLIGAINSYKDFYKFIFEGDYADSIVRERIFVKLSDLFDIDYDDIYHKWLRSVDRESDQSSNDNK